MGDGSFWYNGLKNNLLLSLFNCDVEQPATIMLTFNIDGMSPFNSSMQQFWPISCIMEYSSYRSESMVIAVYHGESKPPLQLYLDNL